MKKSLAQRVACTLILGAAGLILFNLQAGVGTRPSGVLAEEEIVPVSIDTVYLTAPHWDDGKAEVAFYGVHRNRNQYGQPDDQRFLVGTYLVKHDFDRRRQTKAETPTPDSVPSFKSAIFYEFESSNSYQFKRSYVVNASRADLRPLKYSFVSFDWCSNQYRELAFLPDGTVRRLMRSDDYGNREDSFHSPSRAYPVALIPSLIRALDFSKSKRQRFSVILENGSLVSAQAALEGRETLKTPQGPREAEKIRVLYGDEVPSPIGEVADPMETYWRGTDPYRVLLKIHAESGRYTMDLKEQVRSPYWSENIFPSLKQVTERP